MKRNWRLTRAGWFVCGVTAGVLLTLAYQFLAHHYDECMERTHGDWAVCAYR